MSDVLSTLAGVSAGTHKRPATFTSSKSKNHLFILTSLTVHFPPENRRRMTARRGTDGLIFFYSIEEMPHVGY